MLTLVCVRSPGREEGALETRVQEGCNLGRLKGFEQGVKLVEYI